VKVPYLYVGTHTRDEDDVPARTEVHAQKGGNGITRQRELF